MKTAGKWTMDLFLVVRIICALTSLCSSALLACAIHPEIRWYTWRVETVVSTASTNYVWTTINATDVLFSWKIATIRQTARGFTQSESDFDLGSTTFPSMTDILSTSGSLAATGLATSCAQLLMFSLLFILPKLLSGSASKLVLCGTAFASTILSLLSFLLFLGVSKSFKTDNATWCRQQLFDCSSLFRTERTQSGNFGIIDSSSPREGWWVVLGASVANGIALVTIVTLCVRLTPMASPPPPRSRARLYQIREKRHEYSDSIAVTPVHFESGDADSFSRSPTPFIKSSEPHKGVPNYITGPKVIIGKQFKQYQIPSPSISAQLEYTIDYSIDNGSGTGFANAYSQSSPVNLWKKPAPPPPSRPLNNRIFSDIDSDSSVETSERRRSKRLNNTIDDTRLFSSLSSSYPATEPLSQVSSSPRRASASAAPRSQRTPPNTMRHSQHSEPPLFHSERSHTQDLRLSYPDSESDRRRSPTRRNSLQRPSPPQSQRRTLPSRQSPMREARASPTLRHLSLWMGGEMDEFAGASATRQNFIMPDGMVDGQEFVTL